MSLARPRVVLPLVAVLALAAGVAAFFAWQEARLAAVGRDRARGEQHAAANRAAALRSTAQDHELQTARIEQQNAQLRAVLNLGPSGARDVPELAPLTRDMVAARCKRAEELERLGDVLGALQEYLWCYDEGFRRTPEVLHRLALIGERYPPALEALRQRRDQARTKLVPGAADWDALADLVAVNHALRDEADSLAAWDALAPTDPARQHLRRIMLDSFLEAKRYADLEPILPPVPVTVAHLLVAARDNAPSSGRVVRSRRPEGAKAAELVAPKRTLLPEQRSLLATSALALEVAAGNGHLANARLIAGKILSVDNSPQTRELLQRHLDRAGQPRLLDAN